MTKEEITQAVKDNKIVCWSSDHYRVKAESDGNLLTICQTNGNCCGVIHKDTGKLIGKESEYYLLVK